MQIVQCLKRTQQHRQLRG